MVFDINLTISGLIEANDSHTAKKIFMCGVDVGYSVENMSASIVSNEDNRKPMNALLESLSGANVEKKSKKGKK